MQTLVEILAFIGACVILMSVGGWLLYMCFYRTVTLEDIEEEEALTIDDLIN